MKKLALLTCACLLAGASLKAQKPAVVANDKSGWHKITETVVNFEKETDEVSVMLADKFASLKFKVTDAPIDLQDVDVFFEDGTKQTIVIGNNLKAAGESSREIDIKNAEEKRIERIVLRYKTVSSEKGKKGHVEIWGKKTNMDKAADKKGKDAKKDKAEKDNKGKGAEKSNENSKHNR